MFTKRKEKDESSVIYGYEKGTLVCTNKQSEMKFRVGKGTKGTFHPGN